MYAKIKDTPFGPSTFNNYFSSKSSPQPTEAEKKLGIQAIISPLGPGVSPLTDWSFMPVTKYNVPNNRARKPNRTDSQLESTNELYIRDGSKDTIDSLAQKSSLSVEEFVKLQDSIPLSVVNNYTSGTSSNPKDWIYRSVGTQTFDVRKRDNKSYYADIGSVIFAKYEYALKYIGDPDYKVEVWETLGDLFPGKDVGPNYVFRIEYNPRITYNEGDVVEWFDNLESTAMDEEVTAGRLTVEKPILSAEKIDETAREIERKSKEWINTYKNDTKKWEGEPILEGGKITGYTPEPADYKRKVDNAQYKALPAGSVVYLPDYKKIQTYTDETGKKHYLPLEYTVLCGSKKFTIPSPRLFYMDSADGGVSPLTSPLSKTIYGFKNFRVVPVYKKDSNGNWIREKGPLVTGTPRGDVNLPGPYKLVADLYMSHALNNCSEIESTFIPPVKTNSPTDAILPNSGMFGSTNNFTLSNTNTVTITGSNDPVEPLRVDKIVYKTPNLNLDSYGLIQADVELATSKIWHLTDLCPETQKSTVMYRQFFVYGEIMEMSGLKIKQARNKDIIELKELFRNPSKYTSTSASIDDIRPYFAKPGDAPSSTLSYEKFKEPGSEKRGWEFMESYVDENSTYNLHSLMTPLEAQILYEFTPPSDELNAGTKKNNCYKLKEIPTPNIFQKQPEFAQTQREQYLNDGLILNNQLERENFILFMESAFEPFINNYKATPSGEDRYYSRLLSVYANSESNINVSIPPGRILIMPDLIETGMDLFKGDIKCNADKDIKQQILDKIPWTIYESTKLTKGDTMYHAYIPAFEKGSLLIQYNTSPIGDPQYALPSSMITLKEGMDYIIITNGEMGANSSNGDIQFIGNIRAKLEGKDGLTITYKDLTTKSIEQQKFVIPIIPGEKIRVGNPVSNYIVGVTNGERQETLNDIALGYNTTTGEIRRTNNNLMAPSNTMFTDQNLNPIDVDANQQIPIPEDTAILPPGYVIRVESKNFVQVPGNPCFHGPYTLYDVKNYTLNKYRRSTLYTGDSPDEQLTDLIDNCLHYQVVPTAKVLQEQAEWNKYLSDLNEVVKSGKTWNEVYPNRTVPKQPGSDLPKDAIGATPYLLEEFKTETVEEMVRVWEFDYTVRDINLPGCTQPRHYDAFTPDGKVIGRRGEGGMVELDFQNEVTQSMGAPCGCNEIKSVSKYRIYPGDINYSEYRDGLKTQRPATLPYKVITSSLRPCPVNNMPLQTSISASDGIFYGFFPEDIVTGSKIITKGVFDGNETMSCYYTSSIQSSSSKEYYYDVVGCSSDCTEVPYFSVSYGHSYGNGSIPLGLEITDSPTYAIYSQYRLSALELPEKSFYFYTTGSTEVDIVTGVGDIYAISFYRDVVDGRLDPGNFQISLAELNGNAFPNLLHTGSNVSVSSSNKVMTFIDNSMDMDSLQYCSIDSIQTYYDIVSGSLDDGIHSSGTGSIETNPNLTTYGRVYPRLGYIIFDPKKLNNELGFNTVTGSGIAGDNAYKLFTSISGAAALGNPIMARSVKKEFISNYQIRIQSEAANFSNNPTWQSDYVKGYLRYPCFADEPVVYLTSVGLYNDQKELLAIAKFNRPIKKTQYSQIAMNINLGM